MSQDLTYEEMKTQEFFEKWVLAYSKRSYRYDKYLPEERGGLPPGEFYKNADTNEAFKMFLRGFEYGRLQERLIWANNAAVKNAVHNYLKSGDTNENNPR